MQYPKPQKSALQCEIAQCTENQKSLLFFSLIVDPIFSNQVCFYRYPADSDLAH